MNKKTLVKCGVVGLLCLVALSGAVISFGLHQTRAASPTLPSAPSAPSSGVETSQDGVVSSKAPSITFNAIRHWTKQRMKAAHPAEDLLKAELSGVKATPPVQQPSTGRPGMVEPVPPSHKTATASLAARGKALSSKATAVTQPDAYPYSTVGKIFFTYNKTDYVCSGTAIASANESTIDTAGHCVAAGGKSHFYTNWVFCARYSDASGCSPDYMWVANKLFTHVNWAKYGWLTYDYGAAVVTPNSSTNATNAADSLTDAIGGAGVAYNQSSQQNYNALGYPQAPPFNGTRLFSCQSPLYQRDQPAKAGPATSGIACDMTGGSSGGGWLIARNGKYYVNGHNDYKYSNDPYHMYSPYYGDEWFKVYDTAQNYGA